MHHFHFARCRFANYRSDLIARESINFELDVKLKFHFEFKFCNTCKWVLIRETRLLLQLKTIRKQWELSEIWSVGVERLPNRIYMINCRREKEVLPYFSLTEFHLFQKRLHVYANEYCLFIIKMDFPYVPKNMPSFHAVCSIWGTDSNFITSCLFIL